METLVCRTASNHIIVLYSAGWGRVVCGMVANAEDASPLIINFYAICMDFVGSGGLIYCMESYDHEKLLRMSHTHTVTFIGNLNVSSIELFFLKYSSISVIRFWGQSRGS